MTPARLRPGWLTPAIEDAICAIGGGLILAAIWWV